MGKLVQLLTTVENRDQAGELARGAVDGHKAACVQIIGPITSVYRWQGVLREDEEFLCLFKVPREGLEALIGFVRERHSYDTPEIVAVDSLFVDEPYLAWARRETVR